MSENDLIIRKEIDNAINELSISHNDFHEVSKNSWQDKLDNIIGKFVLKNNTWKADLHWAWQRFRGESYAIQFKDDDAYSFIDKLINQDEIVWSVAENDYYRSKFWLYEGKISCIKQILNKTSYFEYYIVSKKYEWINTSDLSNWTGLLLLVIFW